MRRSLADPTAVVPPASRARSILLAAVALVASMQATPARADNCDTLGLRQVCTSSGQFFCGGDRIAGCLHAPCCSDAGCCLTFDQFGVTSAGCCPSNQDYTGTCNNGQCQLTCKTPCGGQQCCLPSLSEVCVPAADPTTEGVCCPQGQACGAGTSSPNCCVPPNVCTPAGTCCAAADVCGNDCCADGVCCNGQCCKAGFTCFGNEVCCPTGQRPCGDNCCARNERCRHPRHKSPVCKCKKKGKKCGGIHCCAGDVCLENGICAPPLP